MTAIPFHGKRSAVDIMAGMVSDSRTPISAMIEIADRCNEVCVHCYQVQGQKGEMSTEQLKKVLDDLAALGVLFLTLSGGEPTLRSDFLEIVAHARLRKFAVKIYTNGLTMTRDLAESLARLAVQEVQISLYSHRAEVHDFVTRVPGSFDKVVAGTRHLRELGVAVVLKTPLMTFNADESDAYVAFVQSLGADFMMDVGSMDPREDGTRDPQALAMMKEQYLRISRQYRDLDKPLPPRDPARPVCGACRGDVHVEANGEMRPCTQLPVAVGHALEDGVVDAVRNNVDGRAIRALTWGDLHGCRTCDLRHYCKRCFATARVESGDALAPYESACRRAAWHYELRNGAAPALLPSSEGGPTSVGPYRLESEGAYRVVSDDLTEKDELLARAHPWVRTHAASSVTPVAPGELVQIRRPSGRTRMERIPGPAVNRPADDGGGE